MRIPSHIVTLIREHRREGWTLESIHQDVSERGYSFSVATIRRACLDIAPKSNQGRTGRRGADPALRAAVVAAWEAGRTNREIAKTFGVAPSTVWKWTLGADRKAAA